MHIVADENIPLVNEFFGEVGEITRVEGRSLSKADLSEADILLVRSVTQVNRELLEGTPVRFVGTATIGTDHIDTAYLEEAGIARGWSQRRLSSELVKRGICELRKGSGGRRELRGITLQQTVTQPAHRRTEWYQ